MKIRTVLFAVMLGVALPAMTGCGLLDQGVQKYDTLVDKDEACNKAWANYESNLQRRSDMIPQLVSVVKGAAQHEDKTLTAVTQARADASKIVLNPANGDFEDAKKFAEYQAAQTKVHTAFQQLQENYPQLQAVDAFKNLQAQIEGTENRLNVARERYNDAVESFNTELRHVSGKVINPITGHEFKPRVFFQVDPEAKKAPSISFDSPAPANSAQ